MTKGRSREEDTRGFHGNPRERRKERHVGAALVSVVVPCYNQARFLDEAIESVLAQGYPHFEILVVDDGSTDHTFEVAARYPMVRYIRQDNQGLAAARNSGLRQSRGSYMVFLDADDRLLPNALEVGLRCLKAHQDCAFVSGYSRRIAADGSPLPIWLRRCVERDHYVELLRRGNYIGMHAAVMYRRSVFDSVGAFDTSVKACEDYDLYLRIARVFSVCGHREVVAEYRQHSSNMSHDSALMLKASLAVLRSQRAYVKRDRRNAEALKTGVRFQQQYYGALLAREVLAHAQQREWGQAVSDLLVLLRHHPRVFVRAWQKLGLSMHLRR